MSPFVCPPAAHAVFAHPQRMLNLTAPGARLASTEEPFGWTELRHCRICASTFLLHGSGEVRRWFYAIPSSDGDEVLAPVIESAATICRQRGVRAADVTRYLPGAGEYEPLTIGEVIWLEEAIGRGQRGADGS